MRCAEYEYFTEQDGSYTTETLLREIRLDKKKERNILLEKVLLSLLPDSKQKTLEEIHEEYYEYFFHYDPVDKYITEIKKNKTGIFRYNKNLTIKTYHFFIFPQDVIINGDILFEDSSYTREGVMIVPGNLTVKGTIDVNGLLLVGGTIKTGGLRLRDWAVAKEIKTDILLLDKPLKERNVYLEAASLSTNIFLGRKGIPYNIKEIDVKHFIPDFKYSKNDIEFIKTILDTEIFFNKNNEEDFFYKLFQVIKKI